MTALSVIYQVIGGAGIPLITSFAGLVIGGVAGLKDGSPKEIVTKTLTGGAVGAWVGGGLGIPAATKLRAAGITQIAVGITLGAWFWWARGRGEDTLPAALVAAPHRLGVPLNDIDRVRRHYPGLLALSDEEIAAKLASGEIALPQRGHGLAAGGIA